MKADFVPTTLHAGDELPAPTISDELKLEKKDRVTLEEIMLDINPNLDPETLGSFSTEDLYRAATRSVYQGVRAIVPKTGKPSGIGSLFSS